MIQIEMEMVDKCSECRFRTDYDFCSAMPKNFCGNTSDVGKPDWCPLKNADGWVSVKYRIPENDRSYLTIGPRGVMRVAKAYVPAQVLKTYGGDPNYVLWTCEGRFVKATHWMPLPEPPKGDDA